MKRFYAIPFVLIILVLFANCKKDDNPGDNEFNGKVNVDTKEATISLPGLVDVRIPQGAFSGDATFTIKALDSTSLPASTDFQMQESFEITSSGGSAFSKDLEIKIKYDDTKGEKIARNNGAAFYNENLQKWIPFSDVSVDTIQKILTINTNHLTKLGRYTYSYRVLGYTDLGSSPHFNIYWKVPGVMTNSEYTSPYADTHAGPDPHYIQDILLYLETSWSAYKAADLKLPLTRINVYVKELPAGTAGVTSFMGSITINQKTEVSAYATAAENLSMTCAHELFHFIQDYYYVQLFSQYGTMWWLEATATQADRIVWPNNPKFEALDPGLDLALNLVRSWDDCLVDPNWYTAGKFLSYLANYRAGAKMSIPEIMKECGKATNVSFFRTIVDSHLKTKLGSTGIGDEFRDFVKCAFDAKGDLKYPEEGKPSIIPARANQNNSILRTKYDVSTKEISVPYLAAGFLKCANNSGEKQDVYAKLDKKSAEVDVFAYRSTTAGPRTFLQQLNEKDSIKITLPNNDEWIDLLVVNKTKDATGSATATFFCEKVPFIVSVIPAKAKIGDQISLTGFSFGSKVTSSDIYFNSIKVNALSSAVKSWTETQIEVKVPDDATTGSISIKLKEITSNKVDFEVGLAAIASVTPARGNAGDEITIKGSCFGLDKSKVKIYFSNAIAYSESFTSYSDTLIVVKVPDLAVSGNLMVYINGVFSNSVYFKVPPKIISLSKTTGNRGDLITITGSKFGQSESDGSVEFNGSAVAEIVSWADTKIEVKVPSNATSGNVVVTVKGEASNGIKFQVAGPQIISLDPESGMVGDAVSVIGANFGSDQTKGEVFFNSVRATEITSWTNTSISVKVPVGALSGDVIVRIDGVPSNSMLFQIKNKPVIDSLGMKISDGSMGITGYKPWGYAAFGYKNIKIFGKDWIKQGWAGDPARTSVLINDQINAQIIGTIGNYIEIVLPEMWGSIQITVVSDGIKSEPKSFYIGIPLDVLQRLPLIGYNTYCIVKYMDTDDGNKEKTDGFSHLQTIETGYMGSPVWSGNILTIVSKYTFVDGSTGQSTLITTFSSDGTRITNMDFQITNPWVELKFTVKDAAGFSIVNGSGGSSWTFNGGPFPASSISGVSGRYLYIPPKYAITGIAEGAAFGITFRYKN